MEMLLKAGARTGPRRSDAEANTPLHDAARRGEVDVAVLLIRHAADPNAINGFGEAPLELALRGSDFMAAAASRVVVEALLRAGACPLAQQQSSGEPCGLPAFLVNAADPETRAILARWSSWWRCRTLAWIRSRGSGHPLCQVMPEILVQVAKFL